MILNRIDSEFLRYLLATRPPCRAIGCPRCTEISEETGMSMGKLREQFEVARTLGLVEASPRAASFAQTMIFCPPSG